MQTTYTKTARRVIGTTYYEEKLQKAISLFIARKNTAYFFLREKVITPYSTDSMNNTLDEPNCEYGSFCKRKKQWALQKETSSEMKFLRDIPTEMKGA